MGFNIYSEMFDQLNGALAAVIAAYSGMVGWISGPLRVGVTIYIILLGIAIIRGAVEYPFREFVYRGIKLAALVYAVTTLYGASVGLLAMNGLPAEVANAVGAQNVTGLGGFFDGILKGAIRAIANIDDIVRAHTVAEGTNLAGIPNNWDEIIASKIIEIVIVLAALLASALGFAICAFALFALSLLAAVGPIFVAALLFETTRSFFFQWLGSVVNYVILVAFALLVTVFIANAADTFIDAITLEDSLILAAVKALGFYALGFFFFLQIPSMAAGLGGGGASLATQFANAATGNVAPMLGRAMSNAPSNAVARAWRAARRGGSGNRATGGTLSRTN
ncbi:type IV secretion system protein [Sphingobium yanoikuyae]|jgi:type IV secretion system protein VirB6|uniref:Type IV secretion system protein VirB6 n=1 Tax=Sphingobium yanoikuyae TaxID=13690 RepID=A0A430BKS5_SPHYA|nr:type IV secretion system protein [Sphingobium yanoikuyae]RSU52253.1 type IV secretion system protein VirB6 [Sphingobium yanoikuyae]